MMKDSVAKRVFWLIIFGALVFSMIYGSFIWSLGQTIQFTQLLVPGSSIGGKIFGIFVQFSPTAFLYLASSYDKSKPDEQNMRLWWLVAFWGVSLFDALTNVGARFDDISIKGLPSAGFDNADFAMITQWMMIVMGVALDFAIVFAEELLGNFLGVFFDNIAALIVLLGGNPPSWLGMASSISRSVGGQKNKPQINHNNRNDHGNRNNNDRRQTKQPQGNRPDNRPQRPSVEELMQRTRQERPQSGRDIPRNRGDHRDNVTIRNGDE
jgi:hypothetical protein